MAVQKTTRRGEEEQSRHERRSRQRAPPAQRPCTDMKLARDGKARIEWADRHMPVLRTIRARFAKEQPAQGHAHRRVPARHHRDREPRPHAAGRRRRGVPVRLEPAHARRTTWPPRWSRTTASRRSPIKGEDHKTYYSHIVALHRGAAAHVTMDDGCDLVTVLHTKKKHYLRDVFAGTEETSSTGVTAPARDGGGPGAQLPGHRHQRRRHQAPVRQPLRHRPEHHGRRHARHQHAGRRLDRGHRAATAGAAAASPRAPRAWARRCW